MVTNKNKAMHSNQKWLAFYRRLGYLMYAVAAADGHISAAEISAVKKEVREKWLAVDKSTDEFDGDAAYQIEVVFDYLQEEAPDATRAFGLFETFFKENRDFFDEALKQRIRETADHIAVAFNNSNKAELSILFRLNKLLQNSGTDA